MTKQVQKIFIKPGGIVATLHKDETAAALRNIGKSTVVRASHVDPDPGDSNKWQVDLRPSGGPVRGGFETRGAALAWEEEWLNERAIPKSSATVG